MSPTNFSVTNSIYTSFCIPPCLIDFVILLSSHNIQSMHQSLIKGISVICIPSGKLYHKHHSKHPSYSKVPVHLRVRGKFTTLVNFTILAHSKQQELRNQLMAFDTCVVAKKRRVWIVHQKHYHCR
jgi:hypothetical protein